MSESQEHIERLWAVSELEQRAASNPDAKILRELADNYDQLGWPEEARRLRAQASSLPDPEPPADTPIEFLVAQAAAKVGETVPSETGLQGRFTPISLIEVFRVLHLTKKSGRLVVEAVGGMGATIVISNGSFIQADSTGGESGEVAMHLAVRIKGGRYHFFPGQVPHPQPNLPEDSASLIEAFAAEVAAL